MVATDATQFIHNLHFGYWLGIGFEVILYGFFALVVITSLLTIYFSARNQSRRARELEQRADEKQRAREEPAEIGLINL